MKPAGTKQKVLCDRRLSCARWDTRSELMIMRLFARACTWVSNLNNASNNHYHTVHKYCELYFARRNEFSLENTDKWSCSCYWSWSISHALDMRTEHLFQVVPRELLHQQQTWCFLPGTVHLKLCQQWDYWYRLTHSTRLQEEIYVSRNAFEVTWHFLNSLEKHNYNHCNSSIPIGWEKLVKRYEVNGVRS